MQLSEEIGRVSLCRTCSRPFTEGQVLMFSPGDSPSAWGKALLLKI